MFLPTTKNEMERLGWERADIILISGDCYIDSPNDGTAVIGKVLNNAGYKVGIIAQPDINSSDDINRLGEPALFWGVSAGCVDSMVANYTAQKKRKNSDDTTPGGENNRRPDRAVMAYTNLIRRYNKNTKPIIIGGIEASLRRVAHYDYWTDSVRRSILFDSKADILVYGMAERTITELAERLKISEDYRDIRGIAYIAKEMRKDFLEIASYEDCAGDKGKFLEMFMTFYHNNDPITANGLCQKHADRYLIQNPPAYHLEQEELDQVYGLKYEYDVHPYYKAMGKVKSLDTIQFSIMSQRGCFGECNFCSITQHQGRRVVSRTEESIIEEAKKLIKHKDFKGYISDVGGASANMYQMECPILTKKGGCTKKRCVFPEVCKSMSIDHKPQIDLLEKLRKLDGIKKVFVGSGVRYDMVIADHQSGRQYLETVAEHHISGQMKIAPEHISDDVLHLMGKPSNKNLIKFKKEFDSITQRLGKKQFLTYYFIAAHPGCTERETVELKKFISHELKLNPEQVQIFTPTPSTISTLMFYTGIDPFTGKRVFSEKDASGKKRQKDIITESSRFRQEDSPKKKSEKYRIGRKSGY